MPKLIIDGKEIEAEEGLTVMQACEIAGAEIPRFCYHERLSIAGNCRMCLVEIEKAPKPVASCAMNIADGMVINTNNERIKAAREGVMEFLLINHPLDCPICDQGGECDLQDQAFKYGKGISTYHENKRAVADKDMGPLVKTTMTRCIHCTRCIRFSQDVAGIEEIGAIGRGEHMEITSYLERSLESEISGNIIDLCPVGALTSKPYEFKARNWELSHTESIDIMDAMGANIRVDSRNSEVMRILPINNDEVNEEWISDKTRFSYDGLKYQRLDRPYLRTNGKLKEISWEEATLIAANKFKHTAPEKIAVLAGDTCDTETLFALKNLLIQLGISNFDANQHGYNFDLSTAGNYLFNSKIIGIDQADLFVLIGADPRNTAPVLNSKIGKRVRFDNIKAYRVGEVDDQTYPIHELGNDHSILEQIASGEHALCAELAKAKRPMFIIGDAIYNRKDATTLMNLTQQIATKYNAISDEWNGFNILHNHAGIVGAIEVGFVSSHDATKKILKDTKAGKIELLYLNNADEIDVDNLNSFIIYQGHHGDRNAAHADLILPSAAYTEKDATYINMEGRPQCARAAIAPPGLAKIDWQIILEIAIECGVDLKCNNLKSLRKNMSDALPIFKHINHPPKRNIVAINAAGKMQKTKITKYENNFYMTNAISRASVTMAKCLQARRQNTTNQNMA